MLQELESQIHFGPSNICIQYSLQTQILSLSVKLFKTRLCLRGLCSCKKSLIKMTDDRTERNSRFNFHPNQPIISLGCKIILLLLLLFSKCSQHIVVMFIVCVCVCSVLKYYG